jgi:energy-coupling factor transport system ATP-binding protein
MTLTLRDLLVRQKNFSLDLGQGALTFAEGSLTLLLGTVGSGKTTLLHTAAGFLPVERGTVAYNGLPLWAADGKRWNPQQTVRVGLLPDEPDNQFFASTVREELLYSLQGNRRKSAEATALIVEALAAVGLAHTEEALMGSPFALSGGQKRRLALAAVLLRKPAWLLLDEPSIGLDGEGIGQLVHILAEQKRRAEGGILLATHDAASFWELADRILILAAGRVVYDGTPMALALSPDIMRQVGLAIPPSLELMYRMDAGEQPNTAHQNLCGMQAGASGRLLAPVEMAELLVAKLDGRVSDERRENIKCGESSGECENIEHQSQLQLHTSSSAINRAQDFRTDARSAQTTTVDPNSTQTVPADTGSTQTVIVGIGSAQITSAEHSPKQSPLMRMDPRAVWLFLLLSTLGVWQQTKPLGLIIGTLITISVVLYSRVPITVLLRLGRIYGIILLFTVTLAGLAWAESGPLLLRLRFDLDQAAGTFVRLYRLYLALWLGLLLPLTQSQLRLKRVLAQSFAPFSRIGLPVEAISLATSLLFRFIPLIQKEWQRFFLLARMRRRAQGRASRLSLGDMRPLLVPFLLALLRLADQVAYALEARGYARTGTKRTVAETFRLGRSDYALILAGVLLATLLYGIALL